MADIRDAIVHLQTITAALTGMKEAPSDPSANFASWPCARAYPNTGTFDIEPAGASKGLHHIVVEMFMPAQPNLAESVKKLSEYIDDFAAAVLAAPTIGGHVATIVTGTDGPPLSYRLVSGKLGSVDTVALRWELTVKITNAL